MDLWVTQRIPHIYTDKLIDVYKTEIVCIL